MNPRVRSGLLDRFPRDWFESEQARTLFSDSTRHKAIRFERAPRHVSCRRSRPWTVVEGRRVPFHGSTSLR